MPGELDTLGRWSKMDEVAKLYIQGDLDAGKIAKKLGMRRADVVTLLDEYRAIARNDRELKDRARELTRMMDTHFSMLIAELYIALEATRRDEDWKTHSTVVKNIADIESKRQDTMQKAGMYSDMELGDELADRERKDELIKNLLKAVAEKYPETKQMIINGLSHIFEEPVSVAVNVQEVQPTR